MAQLHTGFHVKEKWTYYEWWNDSHNRRSIQKQCFSLFLHKSFISCLHSLRIKLKCAHDFVECFVWVFTAPAFGTHTRTHTSTQIHNGSSSCIAKHVVLHANQELATVNNCSTSIICLNTCGGWAEVMERTFYVRIFIWLLKVLRYETLFKVFKIMFNELAYMRPWLQKKFHSQTILNKIIITLFYIKKERYRRKRQKN